MLSPQRWFSRVFQVTSTVWWQSSTLAQQRGTTRWSSTWSTSQQPGVSVFPARHRWQHFTQPEGSLQSASSLERSGTELRTATVGRRGLASTVVRRGIWLHVAWRDSKRAQVEDVARVNPATIHQRTSSASGLSGLVATTREASNFSLTLGATASWSRTKSSSLIWTSVFWQTYATLTAVVQRSEDVGQCELCEGQYAPFLSTGTEGCLVSAILREESGAGQEIDGQRGNDPAQWRPNHQDAQWNCCANDDKRRTFQCDGSTCGDGVNGNDVSLYQALASSNGAQQLARCGKDAARDRGHEYLWLREENELQHLLHREGEAGIHSENVGHSSKNETGHRSHRRARTHSTGVPQGFSLCSGLHRLLQLFRGSIPNEVKGWGHRKVTTFHHRCWPAWHLGLRRGSRVQVKAVRWLVHIQWHQTRVLCSLHTQRKRQNWASKGRCDWHDSMHDGNCRGPKAVLAFCSFNCHLPEESINPRGAWQDPFWDVSWKQAWPFTSSRVWVPAVCAQRSQEETGQQGTGSYFTGILGNF